MFLRCEMVDESDESHCLQDMISNGLMDPPRHRIHETTEIKGRTQHGTNSSIKHLKDHPLTYLAKINQDLSRYYVVVLVY